MILRAAFADDEPLARERLRYLLSENEDVEIVAECRNGRETIAALRERTVDVVLLDIQMPGKDGFDVIAEIGTQHMPVTIFVTAHGHYAIQAFEAHALDYLTKPVEPQRLRAALARARQQVAAKSALTAQTQWSFVLDQLLAGASNKPEYPERILVPNGSRDVFVSVQDIEWIEAANYYSCLHVGERSLMLRRSVKELAATLDPRRFVRVHRSAIVNIDCVREIFREGRSDGWVVVNAGNRVRMSHAGWQSLLAASRNKAHP